MPSRQERRKAERDAAKVTTKAAAAGAVGARGATSTRAHANVTPLGDWRTQTEDPFMLSRAVGANVVKQMADAGDGAAQYSLGRVLIQDAGADVLTEDAGADAVAGAGVLGAAAAEVGSDLCTDMYQECSPEWCVHVHKWSPGQPNF